MSNTTIGRLLKILAVLIDVLGPVAAIFSQFPTWIDRDTKTTISGVALVLVLVACVPLFRKGKEYFKSPSAPVVWFILFIFFTILENIATEIKIVSLFGFIANLIGAVIYKIGSRMIEKTEKAKEQKS